MLTKGHKRHNLQAALASFLIIGVLAAVPGVSWNTFMGGAGWDEAAEIALDASGNIYTVGYSQSTWGSPLNAHTGDYDAYLAKTNNSGVRTWHTFIGGTGWDFGQGIAVDSNGNIYVTGTSQSTWGSPIVPFGGFYDAFVAKYSSSGALLWNTFLGAGGDDSGNDIVLDADGNVYVAGDSGGGWGTPIRPYGGAAADAFVAKLNSNGVLQWNTFLGGTYLDEGYSIAVTPDGAIIVAGETDTAWGTPVQAYNGNDDAFAARLTSDGVLQWHTFLGGSSLERAEGVSVDPNGNVYLTGYSWDGWGTPINPFAGGLVDAFVTKLNASGAYQWHTFLGGSEDDNGRDIVTDPYGNIYVTGYSGASWGAPTNPFSGYYDAFVAKLNGNGVRQWNTFLGSFKDEQGRGIAVYARKYYVTGYSAATWGNPLVGYTQITDGFVAGSAAEPPIFSDVPVGYWAGSYIEQLYLSGITSGCASGPVRYCPETVVTRAQMAVFLLKGIHGAGYTPPAVGSSTGFSDVAPGHWAAAWIEQFAADGITGGCATGRYCPESPVTRAQMAVFLLRAKHGSGYAPPAVGSSTGFGDVRTDHWAAAWIEQLAAEGITGGCGNGNYCPEASVTRAQMAVFLVKTFNLP